MVGIHFAKMSKIEGMPNINICFTMLYFEEVANTWVWYTANKDKNTLTIQDKGIGMIAAALAVGLAAIGSGIAVAVVASSAVGAISENPSLLGKTVIFAGLAEGIAIYGLIISIMILSKI